MADTQAPPAPPPVQTLPPVPVHVTAGWAQPAAPTETKPATERAPRRRGVPAGPALAATGNAAALTVTSAFYAGGWPALAATGAGLVAAGGASVVKRRATVKRRNLSTAASRSAKGGGWTLPSTGSAGRSGGGGSTPRGSSVGGGRGAGGGSQSRPGSSGTVRDSKATRGGATGAGKTGTSRLARLADRMLGGTGKVSPTDKAKGKRKSKKDRKGSAQSGLTRRSAAAARRQAARTWAKHADRRKQARTLAARSVRKMRGASADALKALRSGVWGTIRHWSWAKGRQRALAAWKKHRAKRKTAAAPKPAAATIASSVRRPTATSTPTRAGAPAMSGHHFVAPAMEGARAAANYQPTGMMQVGQDFAGLQQALELHAEAMKVTVENADAKYPLAPQIVELMRQIHQMQLKAAEMARDLQPAFRKLHQVDIARIEQPRKGRESEAMWDVRSN